MSQQEDKEKAISTHLTAYQTRPILSIINEVRLGTRKACTFVGDGKGNLHEISTGMLIYQSKELKEQADMLKKKQLANK